MLSSRAKKGYVLVSVIVLILVTVPYIYAVCRAGERYQFGGFLLNPIDGYSYLSKMYQGQSGQWRFTLPYTARSGEGAYLFLFYVFLGHLSRLLDISKEVMFHGFRILSAGLLLVSMARFFQRSFRSDQRRIFAFSLAAVGSGFGWLGIMGGLFTADFWVAETYPFLASYANPHFPLGLALMLFLLDPGKRVHFGWLALMSLLLSLILPFASLILVLLWVGKLFLDGLKGIGKNSLEFVTRREARIFFIIVLSCLPVLLYDFWVVRRDPILALWNRQNITPSPPLWDVLLSLSPPLLLSLWGYKRAWETRSGKLWIIWIIAGAILTYFPWNLQRRFLLGYYIPLSGVATYGMESIRRKVQIDTRTLMTLAILLAIPTNLIILTSGIQAVNQKDQRIYLLEHEMKALDWIGNHTDRHDLILASPETGLYIPAYTGRKVIYGHPFETTHAERKEKFVRDFFSSKMTRGQMGAFLDKNEIDYVYLGPREEELGGSVKLDRMLAVYEGDKVLIYRVSQ